MGEGGRGEVGRRGEEGGGRRRGKIRGRGG